MSGTKRMDNSDSGQSFEPIQHTEILFVTTGILLNHILSGDPNLESVTHLILDEVHERSLHVDFMLTLLKEGAGRFFSRPSNPLKLILMSATIRDGLRTICSLLRRAVGRPGGHRGPRLSCADSVPGRDPGHRPASGAPHATQLVDFSTLVDECKFGPPDMEGVSDAGATSVQPSMFLSPAAEVSSGPRGLVDAALLCEVVKTILGCCFDADSGDGKGILVFCPGAAEIDYCFSELGHALGCNHGAELMRLHGQLPPEEQRRVLDEPKKGVSRVILSTNVAETSVTVPGITDVVDFGLMRELFILLVARYDPASMRQSLIPVWVPQAAARQRAGRAGRVCSGRCWRLFDKGWYCDSGDVPSENPPEMLRTCLEESSCCSCCCAAAAAAKPTAAQRAGCSASWPRPLTVRRLRPWWRRFAGCGSSVRFVTGAPCVKERQTGMQQELQTKAS
ncbi:unnamed protein product [Prorocentrum cordatum]|uniref:RNA helicase n=1 Tax=Prorocentrum cordatum TaxID=2364126 RepID=A0ABN9T9C8_9DINO|nr:unnamed protein product [Polarella glacialis]